MTLLELRASVRPTLLLAIGLFETRLSPEIRWFENTSSTVIHWITKKNGKAIRVKIWSNSVIACLTLKNVDTFRVRHNYDAGYSLSIVN